MNHRHRIIGLLVDAKHLVKELREDTRSLLGSIACDTNPSEHTRATLRDMASSLVDDLTTMRDVVREVETLLDGREHGGT